MREHVEYDTCGGNPYWKKNQEKKRLFFGGLQGSRITKRGLWVCISDKNKKRGKKSASCKHWPQAGPSSLRKPFLPFFHFFLVPSYVGYVPESDDLGICCFVWRFEFS